MIKSTDKSFIQTQTFFGKISLCLDFIKKQNLKDMPLGKHFITDDISLNIEEYTTQQSNKKQFEAHKKFIDLQYMIFGNEIIEVCDILYLENATLYNEEKDVLFYENTKDKKYIQNLLLNSGEWVLLFPEDGHKPCIQYQNAQKVRKAVFKIPV